MHLRNYLSFIWYSKIWLISNAVFFKNKINISQRDYEPDFVKRFQAKMQFRWYYKVGERQIRCHGIRMIEHAPTKIDFVWVFCCFPASTEEKLHKMTSSSNLRLGTVWIHKLFEMMNQDSKTQGWKFQVLLNHGICCRDLGGWKLRAFSHACTVSALFPASEIGHIYESVSTVIDENLERC